MGIQAKKKSKAGTQRNSILAPTKLRLFNGVRKNIVFKKKKKKARDAKMNFRELSTPPEF